MSRPRRPARPSAAAAHPLAAAVEGAPWPFAVTEGKSHELVYANASFRKLIDGPADGLGVPIDQAFPLEGAARLVRLLDRIAVEGKPLREQFLGPLKQGCGLWSASLWQLSSPQQDPGVGIELRSATHGERSAALQREVAERLLLSALREADAADAAEASRVRTTFLIEAGRRLGASLDEGVTRSTVAGLALPALGAWCIVDVVEPDGSLTRLAMIHPDPAKRELVQELALTWAPEPGDPFGAPAVLRNAQPVVARIEAQDVTKAVEAGAHSPQNLRLLEELGLGPLLTVPLVSHGQLLGAITFVSGRPDRAYTSEDIDLAEGLAARSAEALNSARLYGEALALRELADASSETRMRFLGNISHELRTPLNAIGGYAQLMEAEIHGPITDAQRRDLERIRLNQEHLLVLITDILNFVRAGLTPVARTVPVSVHAVVDRAVAMLEGLAVEKSIGLRKELAHEDVLADADPDRLQQILLNLISNAIKFTPPGGTITVRYETAEGTVRISVSDTGKGIPPEKMKAIFEPFVQVDTRADVAAGVGLGLAISRDLARSMRGDLEVESTLGAGSRFTLTLPVRQRAD